MTRLPPRRCVAGFIFALETEADPFAARVRDANLKLASALVTVLEMLCYVTIRA
jgi:hypothetical protein